jgi:hypothetical protein
MPVSHRSASPGIEKQSKEVKSNAVSPSCGLIESLFIQRQRSADHGIARQSN